MMKKLFVYLLLIAATALPAQNIVKNSDFNADEKKPGPEFRTNGGKLTVFTENATWNRCGKLAFDKLNQKGKYRTLQAAVWIGGKYADKNAPGGFPCKPNTTYDFSIDIKSNIKSGGQLRATVWNAKQTLWHGKTVKSTAAPVKYNEEWTTYKGSFRTREDSVSAALNLSISNYERYSPFVHQVGDYILFDNIVIKERKRPALNDQSAPAKVEVDIRKIIPADGTNYSDFHRFKSNKALTAKTSFNVRMTDQALVITFDCEEPKQVTPATSVDKLWSGDVVEFFFTAKKPDREHSQFAVSANNYTFTSIVNGKNLDWSVKTHVTKQGWGGTAVIPFASLGWDKPQKGDFIGFNIARQRRCIKELSSWGKVASGFSDLKYFGRIYCGSFPAGTSREAFEKAQAEAEAKARQEKIDSFRKQKMLCAPVNITDDFSLPFLPDALFEPLEKIELRTAVNEIRPLPIAVYNNSAKTAFYQVTAEIPRDGSFDWHNGRLFPGVTYREAVAHRDNSTGSSAIFDPLPRMNEARIVTVPAGECALVWLDFSTYDLKPGEYKGRLRILQVNGKGVFTTRGKGRGNYNYNGDMKDIPLTLTVNDIVLDKTPRRPCNYFSAYTTDKARILQDDIAMRIYRINPWSLKFPLKDGKFTPVTTTGFAEKLAAKIKSIGCEKILVCYSSVYTFTNLYGKKNLHLFVDWVKTVEMFLKKNGFDPARCYIEIYDEPPFDSFKDVEKYLKDLHAANLQIKLCITLGAGCMNLENMKKIALYVDHWILWRHGYFKTKEQVNFIREQQAKGVTFGHYTCSTDIRASLSKNFRHNAWFGEYQNMDSNDMYQSIKGLPNMTWKGNGGDSLLYNSEEVVVPSIRYMALRQGITDVKYLDKLREIGKDSPEAQAFLKTAAKRVVVDKAHDPAEADKVREEAAQLILKLKK